MSKKFLSEIIQDVTELSGVASRSLAAHIVDAIKAQIVEGGRFTLPEFGTFIVRETPARTALNPRTGEPVAVDAFATVKFKASPSLREAAYAALRKAKRKTRKVARKEVAGAP
jgi:DNA-binding protein HU-beta